MLRSISIRTLAVAVIWLSVAVHNSASGQRRFTSLSRPGSEAELVAIEQVQRELKLDEKQKTELKKVTDKLNDEVRALSSGLSRSERRAKRSELDKKTADLRAAAETPIRKFLDEKQRARLAQIVLWSRGADAIKDLDEALKLTKEQSQQLAKLGRQRSEKTTQLVGKLRDRSIGGSEFMQRYRKLQRQTDKERFAVLNKDQTAAYEKLKGPKFELVRASSRRPASRRSSSRSATSKHIQKRTYDFKEAGRKMEYALFVPSKYSAKKNYPLMVALHGLGSNPQQIIRYPGLTDLAEKHGYIVVAPMGYNSRGWYGSRGQTSRRDNPKNLGELSEKDVMNVLKLTQKEFSINDQRIYLMGHSMGGGGTWHLGIKYPRIWTALAPIAPAVRRSTDDLKKIQHLPVIVVQGDQDRLVPVSSARRWVAKMKDLMMDHVYIEVAGGDHVNVAFQNLPKIFDFFNKHTTKHENKK